MPRSPTLSALRTAIVTAIQTGMNPGNPGNVTTVNDYLRFWRDKQYFEKLFKRPANDLAGWAGLINGWMIKITSKEVEGKEWFRFYIKYRVEMHGYLGLQDGQYVSPKTQKDFLDQVDLIKDQLRMNTTVFNNTEETSPVTQLEEIAKVEIAETTCWYALLTLECEAIDTRFS